MRFISCAKWRDVGLVLAIITIFNAAANQMVNDIINHNFNAMVGRENLTCNGQTSFANPVGCVELCFATPFPILKDKATIDAGLYLAWLPCYNASQEVEKEERDAHGCLHKFKKTLMNINSSLSVLIISANKTLCHLNDSSKIMNLSRCLRNLTGFSKKIIKIEESMNVSFIYKVKEKEKNLNNFQFPYICRLKFN